MQFRIRELRETQNMTQEDLASRSGVSRATICGLENGSTTITKTDTLMKIANALGTKVSEIFLE